VVTTRLIGLALIVLGVGLRAWAQLTLRAHGIDTREKLAQTVTPTKWATTGPYRYRRFRHPLYAAHLVVVAGVGIVAFGAAGCVLALAALPHYQHRAFQENAWRAICEKQSGLRRAA
jgi:protein-S-isoprenylcysteine O-methyltransferase Ste14